MNLFKALGRSTTTVLAATFMLLGCLHLQAQTPKEWKQLKGDVTLSQRKFGYALIGKTIVIILNMNVFCFHFQLVVYQYGCYYRIYKC